MSSSLPRAGARRADSVIAYLMQMLALPEHGPGYKLAPERELAAELQVSRRVVREALEQLEREGFIERVPGRGTIVVENKEKTERAVALHVSPMELMTARYVLEPAIAATAATHASTHDIQMLLQCHEQSHNARSHVEWEEGDSRFHEALATATHNILLQHFSEVLTAARMQTEWGRLRRTTLDLATRNRYSAQHQEIVDAIRHRDPAQAGNAMRTHLNAVRQGLEEQQR
ncbi:FCD domain-containing protein [Paenalcaligenes niemegkensis]|uniref:FadR/GntR family transcriptional regulator n=1 Tax=Paenalcaligenes niemegkensis TaxID=2895469 RepID=UPI001EE7C3D3|nr:FCD domain-containing protein [Paenalcaligenes niemegkensis]MCQ9617796.1 FCD domain-containing protein [Paenalcaligenes niemegkensis]